MFDFSFGEMLVVAVVALVVLGPERLPKAARFAGLWVRKARAQWYSVKSELEQELASEELKRSLQDSRRALDEAEAGFRDIASEAARGRQADAAEAAAATSAEPATAGPSDGAPADAEALAFKAAAPAGPATTPRGGQDG